MGLFGGLFKALGKVVGGAARAVASTATGGASDKFLSILKSSGKAKTLAAAGMLNNDMKARTMQTEALQKRLAKGTRHYSRDAFEEGDIVKAATKAARKRLAARKRARQTAEALDLAGVSGVRQGLLDLKAMSAAWRAAEKLDETGKAISWKNWIKRNPLYLT